MDAVVDLKPKCVWKPNLTKSSNVSNFMKHVNAKFDLKLESYQDLYYWSIQHYVPFWEEVFNFSNIIYSQKWDEVCDKTKLVSDVPEWFHGCLLNYAENMLRYDDDRVAIYGAFEGAEHVRSITFAELRRQVALYASAMRKMGVTVGDRVTGYLPNCIEAVVAMLATSSIGAIWSSASPDFGVQGVLDRFSQIRPKLLFTIDSVIYNGRRHGQIDKVVAITQGLPDLQTVVLIPNNGDTIDAADLSAVSHSVSLSDFLATGLLDGGAAPPLKFEQLPFNHPLYIMYSSGTTGAPKCMVHSAGGSLLKHVEELQLQCNLTRDDVIMYYTTLGWMMWNWFVSSLAIGATIVCYDGSPLIPHANVLWDLVDKVGMTVLGTGAKWLSVLEEKEVKPINTHNLKSLRMILSTGSPLKPQSFDYVYQYIKPDICLSSISGGTDIVGCFIGGCVDLPVYRGEIQCRLLGMAIESWNEDGKHVNDESGELVCVKPFPSMPTHFWNDKDGKKYHNAYFDRFPGVWTHGDYCIINSQTGGLWMLGRSDSTLNPNGVRFGTAEIYHIVESFKEIQDSLCIAQRSKDLSEERVILFLKMAPGSEFSSDLCSRMRTAIRTELSARHVPALILETKDIPYTHSGKKVEVAVRKIVAGETVKDRGSYSNPNSLDGFANIPELQDY